MGDNNTMEVQKEGLDAYSLSAVDASRMAALHSQYFLSATDYLSKLKDGIGYTDGASALYKAVQSLDNDICQNFASQNKWLSDKNERSKFLNDSTSKSQRDKEAVLDLYDLVTSARNFNDEVAKFFVDILNNSVLYYAFVAIRFGESLKAQVMPGDDYGDMDKMFIDFQKLYEIVNDAEVYRRLRISKSTHTPEEIIKSIRCYVNEKIQYTPGVGAYMPSYDYMSAEYINKWHGIDKVTRRYYIFKDQKSAFQDAANKCKQLEEEYFKIIGMDTKVRGTYGNGYTALFTYIRMTVEKGIEVIDGVENLKEDAFKVFIYPVSMRECVSKMALGDIANPKANGTHYGDILEQLPKRLTSLINYIAKLTPQ